MTIDDLYRRGRGNSLNLVRLALAAFVILWHSYAVLGIDYPAPGLSMLLGNMPVNGFFAISGFLIYRSWVNRPHAWDFLVARVVRIYPAFWVCLIVTAFIVAPLGAVLQEADALAILTSPDAFSYVWKNSTLAMLQWRIDGTPTGVPFETSWNASLWTLAWEFLCYLFVLVLGALRLLRRTPVLWIAFCVSLALATVTLLPGLEIEVLARVGRFFSFFLAGALVAHHAARIPARLGLGLASLVIAVASCWTPWGIVLQVPLAALGLVMTAGLLNPKWAEMKNDLSYGLYIYAFPVQQLVFLAGGAALGLHGLSLVSLLITVPLAAASWFLIERPALRLRRPLTESPWAARLRAGVPRAGVLE